MKTSVFRSNIDIAKNNLIVTASTYDLQLISNGEWSRLQKKISREFLNGLPTEEVQNG